MSDIVYLPSSTGKCIHQNLYLYVHLCKVLRNVIDTCLGEGPLVVERKGSAIYTSCTEVPTKMLCILMSSCSNTEHVTA